MRRLVHISFRILTRSTKTVVVDILRMSIAVIAGVMCWSIAFLRWAIIVLRNSVGILGRTVAVLRQAIVVLGRTISITNSMFTFCTLIVASSAWRAGRTLVRWSGSSPVVHLTWPPAVGEARLRCGLVQGDKASTAGWRLDRGWSKLVAH